MKYDIGIIGALENEVSTLAAKLSCAVKVRIGGVDFITGALGKKNVVVAKCGVGKVFAAVCAAVMIVEFSPSLIINTGVGGGLKKGIAVGDIVVADKLCQHDMDTSALGDPKGLISGINRVFFKSDKRALDIVVRAAAEANLACHVGTVASGDKFICESVDKLRLVNDFGADVCEMEGAAIAQTAFVNSTPFIVIRAISDSADEGSSMDYMKFMPIAAERSAALALALCEKY